jgi:hypothetical protein
VLEVGSSSKFQLLPHFYIVRPLSGSTKELGSASIIVVWKVIYGECKEAYFDNPFQEDVLKDLEMF